MSKTPFMPLWVNDFIGDTLDLDAKEIGAYMLILMAMWGRDGTLPDDEKKLRRVARVGRDWGKVWASVGPYFTRENGIIFNKRLRQEFLSVAAKRVVKAQQGALGGQAKALKSKELGLADANGSLQRKSTIPEPEPYKDKRDTSVSTKKPPRRAVSISENWQPTDANIKHALSKNLSHEEIQNEANRFRDYHLSRGTTFKDWNAGWRTWVGNAVKYKSRNVAFTAISGGRGQGGSIASIVARREFDRQNGR